MISQLETFTKQLNEELNNYIKSAKNTPKGKNMPNTVGIIVWITQSENTVKFYIFVYFYFIISILYKLVSSLKLFEIIKNTEFFLSDIAGYKKFQSSTNSLLGDFKRVKQEYFRDWCDNTLSNIKDRNSDIR